MTAPAPADRRGEESTPSVRRIRVTRGQKMAAQYLVERAEATGQPVRPAYRAIANAK